MPAELVLLPSERSAVLDEVTPLSGHGHDAARTQQTRELLHPRQTGVLGQVGKHRVGGNEVERTVGERGRWERIDAIEAAVGKRCPRGIDQHRIDINALQMIGWAILQEAPKDASPRAAKIEDPRSAVDRVAKLASILLDERDEREGFPKRLLTGRTYRVALQHVIGKTRHANAVDNRFGDASHQQREPLVVGPLAKPFVWLTRRLRTL